MTLRILALMLWLRLVRAIAAPWRWWNGHGEYDPFGEDAHNKEATGHSRAYGHFCAEWDGLWICQDCGEFAFCECFAPNQPPCTAPLEDNGTAFLHNPPF